MGLFKKKEEVVKKVEDSVVTPVVDVNITEGSVSKSIDPVVQLLQDKIAYDREVLYLLIDIRTHLASVEKKIDEAMKNG